MSTDRGHWLDPHRGAIGAGFRRLCADLGNDTEPKSEPQTKPNPLPSSLPPRGLSRKEAACYLGIGTTLFDELVAAGELPVPKRVRSRTIWDRAALDQAFAVLDGGSAPPTNGDAAPRRNRWDQL